MKKMGCVMTVLVEYAGFTYELKNGKAVPTTGQHKAANKEKHRRAALKLLEELQDGIQ